MAEVYDFNKVESKWRDKWAQTGIYETPDNVTRENKYYILPQLPYPSGSGLHVGHAEVYSACDILTRFKRMKDKKVLQVIGWDAFGLPAENYAIKTNIHPRINTDKAIDNFREQIKKMGVSVDWDREVGSHNPDYYKWTQWFFLLMYNQGLAYRKKQKVNWCDSCKTVLANEQVIEKDGLEVCERCDTEIQHKMMEQWYLKITDYADRLVADLDKVDWPAETVKRQRDWIGRSEGALIDFQVKNFDKEIKVFTTRPDTVFGATYMVLAPEHPLVEQITTEAQKDKITEYVKKASKKSEIERTDMTKEKTGVFTGAYAINPANGNEIPIWVADYVLLEYGTGAIMAVPAHDERDFEFAQKFDLEVIEVVEKPEGFDGGIYTGIGNIKNSGEFNGASSEIAKGEIVKWLESQGKAEFETNYKIRDWSVSRQRFWGAPIPMLHRELTSEMDKLNKIYQDNPSGVINFHAWESSSEETYHPWIGEKLEKDSIDYVNPDLPNPGKPDLTEWVQEVESKLKTNSDLSNYIVSGRSIGGWAALKFAEKHKIRKLILVAPTVPHNFVYETWEKNSTEEVVNKNKQFIGADQKGNLDFEKVKENVGEVVVFISKDDPYISYQDTIDYLREKLPFTRVVSFRDAGHFSADTGFTEFPKLYEEILADVRLDLKPVFMDDLPVELPDDVDFKPTGQSPLTYSKKFQEGVKEKYGEEFSREPDTLDTFMCSSWYYFRYLDPHNDKAFASKETIEKWMPVDFYLGGPEHVNGHLLYSRFFTKVLYDAGIIDFDEPFLVHRHQGLILGEDNRKMSKRWGNVINPSDVVDHHGADTLRMYEMFMGPLTETKPWDTKGEQGVFRFINKVWNLQDKVSDVQIEGQSREVAKLINKVEEDISNLSFNTSVAKFMEFSNFLMKQENISKDVWEKFLLALAPFAPFITEELWAKAGHDKSIHIQDWPDYDKELLIEDQVTIAVQVNGKLRDTIDLASGSEEAVVKERAMSSEKVKKYIETGEIKKIIFVKDKLISFVVA